MAAASLVAETEVNKVTPVFFGSTKSMPLKWPTLDKMEQEMLLKIITGEKPVDYFDEFVTEWNKTCLLYTSFCAITIMFLIRMSICGAFSEKVQAESSICF